MVAQTRHWKRRRRERRENIIYYHRNSQTRGFLTVVLVCFGQRAGTNIYGGELLISTSTKNMVLINNAPSTFNNEPK